MQYQREGSAHKHGDTVRQLRWGVEPHPFKKNLQTLCHKGTQNGNKNHRTVDQQRTPSASNLTKRIQTRTLRIVTKQCVQPVKATQKANINT